MTSCSASCSSPCATVFAFAVIVALGAWLAGPGRLATRIRTGTRSLFSRAPGQTAISPRVAGFVEHYRTPLRVLVVGVGLLILVVINHPGVTDVVVVAILVLLFLGVIELLGRNAPAPAEQADSKTKGGCGAYGWSATPPRRAPPRPGRAAAPRRVVGARAGHRDRHRDRRPCSLVLELLGRGEPVDEPAPS